MLLSDCFLNTLSSFQELEEGKKVNKYSQRFCCDTLLFIGHMVSKEKKHSQHWLTSLCMVNSVVYSVHLCKVIQSSLLMQTD